MLECLDSKYSHQATCNEYVKLVGMLLKQNVDKASEEETDSPSRGAMASEFSKRLTRIAETTSKLQAVLNEDEQKILHLLNFEWIRLYWRKTKQR